MFGYEMLSFFIGRNENGHIDNFVKYFKNIEELENYLKNFEFVIDKEFAIRQIENLNKKINKIKLLYQIG